MDAATITPGFERDAQRRSMQRMVGRHSWCVLIHADSLTVMDELREVDAVVTDPPYNIGWRPRVNHQNDGWTDNEPFDPAPWLKIGSKHLFWGGNYIADKLPPSQSWHVWVKRPSDFDFSNDPRTYATIELAWSDYGTKARHKVQDLVTIFCATSNARAS